MKEAGADLQRRLTEGDPYRVIAFELQCRVGDAVVGVGAADPVSGRFVLRAALGLGGMADMMATLLGGRVLGWAGLPTEDARRALLTGRFQAVESLYEVFFRRVPMGLSGFVQSLICIEEIYAAGLVCRDELLGSVVLGLRAGQRFEGDEEIHAFLAQCAEVVSVQRRQGGPAFPRAVENTVAWAS